MTTRLLATGTILLAVGLMLTAAVAEWFAAFDACLASARCAAPASVASLSLFLGFLVAGVVLAVLGVDSMAIGLVQRAESGPTSQ
jgi:hypothetical protein